MNRTENTFHLLGRQIVQGVHAPGTLPTEAELCRRFDVPRGVMREALQMLAARRLVAADASPRRGFLVLPIERWNYLDADVLGWALEKQPSLALLRSLNEMRAGIEPSISRWAAEHATEEDVAEIEECFHAMADNHEDAQRYHEADILFHRAVLMASHNLVIVQLSDTITAMQRGLFHLVLEPLTGHIGMTIHQHLELFEAIRRKNPDSAEEITRQMVSRTANRTLAVVDAAQPAPQ